jgi:hypothetical protein
MRITNVATLTLGLRPRQGLTKVRAKNEVWESHAPGSVGKCEGMNLPYSQVNSHFGNWSPDRFLNLHRAISRVKFYYIEKVFIPLKRSSNLNV